MSRWILGPGSGTVIGSGADGPGRSRRQARRQAVDALGCPPDGPGRRPARPRLARPELRPRAGPGAGPEPGRVRGAPTGRAGPGAERADPCEGLGARVRERAGRLVSPSIPI